MNMFGDIATESTVERLVGVLEKDIKENPSREAQEALKKIGRYALDQLLETSPRWATKYRRLFAAETRG